MDYTQRMQEYIASEIQAMQNLDLNAINEAANAIIACRDRGGTIYTIGNGGSAATASHIVVDLGKGASDDSACAFRMECLADNTPIVTAIANDICYDDIFVYQLKRKLRPEDLLIAISGSGNSPNIIRAAEYAKSLGVQIIGMTGYQGGKLAALCDYAMHVNVDDMQIAEDLHLMLDHMLLRVFAQ